MPWILVKTDGALPGGRRFVAPAGSASSYTRYPERAQQFPSREAAQANACGNETPVNLWAYRAARDF